jgi:putative cardiolipin synthase
MQLVLIVSAAVLLFVAASFVAVYSYGRFAKRVRGKPSYALPLAEAERLSTSIGTLMAKAEGSNSYDAAEFRALPPGRSPPKRPATSI